MDTQPDNKGVLPPTIRKLMWYFGIVYFAQGVGQAVAGLVSQPVDNYLKSLGYDAAQATELLACLVIPWVIKPLYGLISDFVPLLGYHRKSYLLLMNGLAAAAFIWLFGLTSPGLIVVALTLTCIGTAASDVLVDALMVENGQRSGYTKDFQSVQWGWGSVASILVALSGGFLCQYLSPLAALQTAALISALAPAAVMVATWWLVEEERSKRDLAGMKATGQSLIAALKSRTLWVVAAFLAFWNFSPGLGRPMYYWQTDHLKFDQDFIGQLTAIGFVGYVIGAIIYRRYLAHRFSTRSLVCLSIALGTAGTLAYLFMVDRPSAAAIYLFNGTASVIVLLTLLSMAADACPRHAEGFTFAALMSVFNAAQQVSAIVGARLYVDWFDSQIAPLIWVSALFTFAAFLFVPFLQSGPQSK